MRRRLGRRAARLTLTLALTLALTQVAYSDGVLLAYSTTANLLMAMLLLLRDALRTEASASRHIYSFTAYPPSLDALRDAIRALPDDERDAIRCLLPRRAAQETAAQPAGSLPHWAMLLVSCG